MKRLTSYAILAALAISSVNAGGIKPTKNIIVMIPDGTSLSVLSASRWLKSYKQEGNKLELDPYMCGTVTTFCSNSPIGDSAPTTSCYMTGTPEQAGNIAIYPVATQNDLVKLNPDSAYQPLATLLEAMKIKQKKAAGLVVTCEFPHATPADCSAHTYNRANYKVIAPQMAFNNLDVMFGGGNSFITDEMKQHFKDNGTTFIQDDKNALLNFKGEKLWALYEKEDIPYDLDRDTTAIPSLSQMTSKALEILEKNRNGFFLMVEGSKVDWAAHANDPVALLTEFLAFDKAVGVVMDYARRQGNTTVIVLPDHGNSGFSIGRYDLKNYSHASRELLFGNVARVKKTAVGIEEILKKTAAADIKNTFKQLTDIELNDEELTALQNAKSTKSGDYTEAGKGESLSNVIMKTITKHTYFGFTSNGHTGEEVFLAAYHPKGNIPTGNLRNYEINSYLQQAAGLKQSLAELTSEIYCKHTEVFKGMNVVIAKNADQVKLIVHQDKNTLIIPAYSSVATYNGQKLDIGSVAVYVDKTDMFYLPKSLRNLLIKK